MARHWQRRPLLVRGALPDFAPPLSRTELFALAARDGVESRLVRNTARGWSLAHGPFARSALPPVRQRGWTLLVQGVDLHHAAAHDLLRRFRFVPDARLDDLMISWASDGGGVGPHVDSYDVFLLQARGLRRWRVARHFDVALDERAPLKVLRRFAPRKSTCRARRPALSAAGLGARRRRHRRRLHDVLDRHARAAARHVGC
jgi:50S ribosomal protein L16 3-hydroxylase